MALAFDIETIGINFDSLDETSKSVFFDKAEKASDKEGGDKNKILEDLKEMMCLSPLTGEIAAIGVLDTDNMKGAVYFQSPDKDFEEVEEDGCKLKAMSEKEMLIKFWELCEKYQEFATYNGRGFDVPYLMIRSAVHEIKPSKNLLSNRYLFSQKFDSKHVDLMDQLSFYGAIWEKPKLHLVCRAFGVKSPKEDGVAGDDVGRLFKEKKYLEIAKYNVRDIKATAELYNIWNKYLNM